MKYKWTSFLFFIFVFLTYTPVTSQTIRDSINHYMDLVVSPKKLSDLNMAYRFFNDLKETAMKDNDTANWAFSLIYIGSIEYKFGAYSDSESTNVEALRLLKGIEDHSYRDNLDKSIHNQLAILYREQHNTKKSLELYNDALARSTRAEDSVTIFNNQSNIYKDNKEYRKAKEIIDKAVDILPRVKDTTIIARVYDNLGFLKFELGETNALGYLNKGLELRLMKKDTSEFYPSYKNLSLYHETTNKTLSEEYALKALSVAKAINSLSYKEDIYDVLANLSPNRYFKDYKRTSDSLYRKKQSEQNRYALLKYNYSEFKRQAAEKGLEVEKERSLKIFYEWLFLFIVVVSITIYLILRSRHKKKELQQVYNTETRISQKVHDEIANGIYNVMSKLQSSRAKEEVLLDDLENLYNKTRDISRDNSDIDFKTDFKLCLNDLLASYRTDDINIVVKGISDVNWNSISKIRKTAIYRVLQELLINMKKHSRAKIVMLSFSVKNRKVQIEYRDNGIGCELRKKGGLQNAENRIEAVKGTIIFESETNKGFKTTILV